MVKMRWFHAGGWYEGPTFPIFEMGKSKEKGGAPHLAPFEMWETQKQGDAYEDGVGDAVEATQKLQPICPVRRKLPQCSVAKP